MGHGKGLNQVRNTEKLLKQKGYVGNKEVAGFVLLLEDLHLAEVPIFKTSIIEQYLKKGMLKNEKVYFMRIFELEKMQDTIKKYTFETILKKKIEIDKENNIAHGRDFLFACKEIDGNLDMRSRFLENVYNELFSEFVKNAN